MTRGEPRIAEPTRAGAVPGLSLHLGLGPDSGPGGQQTLVSVAKAIVALVRDLAPEITTSSTLSLDGYEVRVDAVAREVTIDGHAVALTFKEFELLEYLLRSPHRAVSREELLRTVWNQSSRSSGSRTIDVHVRRLREKLGGCLQIVTVRGVGYRCDPTPEVVLVGSGDAD